jgi:histidyl-tRNA synthetase
MTIGMCLDYIEEYFDQEKPAKERKRKAKQADFDSF